MKRHPAARRGVSAWSLLAAAFLLSEGCSQRHEPAVAPSLARPSPSGQGTRQSRPAAPPPSEPSGVAPAPSAPSGVAPGAAEPLTERGTVYFTTATGEVPIEVEVARSDEERQTGLMHRKRLDPGRGMLFLMPGERVHAFWMRNTLIPLDMIFISGAGVVVGVVENAAPLTDTPRMVRAKSRYVVEIAGGHARLMGVAEGSRMRVVGVPGLPVTRGTP